MFFSSSDCHLFRFYPDQTVRMSPSQGQGRHADNNRLTVVVLRVSVRAPWVRRMGI
jgi:hypothetical protein